MDGLDNAVSTGSLTINEVVTIHLGLDMISVMRGSMFKKIEDNAGCLVMVVVDVSDEGEKMFFCVCVRLDFLGV